MQMRASNAQPVQNSAVCGVRATGVPVTRMGLILLPLIGLRLITGRGRISLA